MGGAGAAEGAGRAVTFFAVPTPEQARVIAMGQLAQARTHLILADRLLQGAGQPTVPAELAPKVRALCEQVEQLGLVVAGLDPEKSS